MNITSDKIFSNSTEFQKKIKSVDSTELKKATKSKITEKLLKDFSSVSSTDQYIKTKIKSNNIRLTAYELDVSKSQITEKKLEELTNLVNDGKSDEAWKIISETKFDNKSLFEGSFSKNKPLSEQVDYLKSVNSNEKLMLEKEFASIQIASQNLSSVSREARNVHEEYSTSDSINASSIENMNINNKRVMDLVL